MGSGSSKRHRPSSESLDNSDVKLRNKIGLGGIRSISFPSRLSALQKSTEDEVFSTENSSELILNLACKNFSYKDTKERLEPCHQVNVNEGKTSQNGTGLNPNAAAGDTLDISSNQGSNGNYRALPERTDTNGIAVKETSALTLTELYNILVSESWLRKPQLLTPEFLLLLDCRSENEYKMKHIITARHHAALQNEYGCLLSIPGQLESFDMIILYNDDSKRISDALQERGIDFFVLNLGYEAFEKKYPFLCTADAAHCSEEQEKFITWPSEILENKIYQGNATHALDEGLLQTLGITHVVNVTKEHPNAFPDMIKYMRLELDDEVDVDLFSWLPSTCKFIDDALSANGQPEIKGERDTTSGEKTKKNHRVLVHCNMGRSRSSTVVLGYLMEVKRWCLQDACDWLKDCRQTAKPNVGFLNQLLAYEEKLFGRKLSDFHQLPF